jgi:endogenous inhibitor of DNA gyrase (YacG/DUF329 family)
MTHSPTPAERLAIRTGNAALLRSASPTSHIVETVVFALGAAGLLMDPETAEELRQLRAAAGDGATRTVDEDPIAYALTELAAEVNGQTCEACGEGLDDENISDFCSARCESVGRLRRVLARQRDAQPLGDREDRFVSPLHRDYRTPHDLPAPEVAP